MTRESDLGLPRSCGAQAAERMDAPNGPKMGNWLEVLRELTEDS